MKPSERNDIIRSYFEHDMALLKAKGHDYAGGDDCLSSLRRFGYFGIIVRLSDKFSRLETLAKSQGAKAVPTESEIDTLRDIRNYAFLAQIFLEGKDRDPEIPLFTKGDSVRSIEKIVAETRAEIAAEKKGAVGQLDPGTFRPKGYLSEDEAREFIDELDLPADRVEKLGKKV